MRSTRSLSTAEDHTHIEGLLGRHGRIVAFKGQLRHTISAGEQFLDGFLVSYRLRGFTLDRTHGAPERNGQLGPIGKPHLLQITLIVSHFIEYIGLLND